jgi:hypothetical protein
MTQSSATQRGSEPADVQFNTDRTHAGRWTITFSKPADQHVCSHNDPRIGSANDRPRGGPVREGRSFPVANRDFFIALSR